MSASNKGTLQPLSASIGAKIAPAEAAQIRELIEAGLCLGESDLVRDAIGPDCLKSRSSNAGTSIFRWLRKRFWATTTHIPQ